VFLRRSTFEEHCYGREFPAFLPDGGAAVETGCIASRRAVRRRSSAAKPREVDERAFRRPFRAADAASMIVAQMPDPRENEA
jgi:hypothetical protein